MITLEYDGAEKSLADWDMEGVRLKWSTQQGMELSFAIGIEADTPDLFPFKAKVILRANRTAQGGASANPSLPVSGAAAFSGGFIVFIGYLPKRGHRSRLSSGAEGIAFRFVDALEFCFGRCWFRKARNSFNGSLQTQINDMEFVLGYSANFNFSNENYLSIRQQLCEIAAWASAKSALESGSAQFQFDTLTHAIDGADYDFLQNATANCSIPDYVPGTYGATGASGPDLGTCLNPNGLVLRCALDATNNMTCLAALQRTLEVVGGPGNCATWFDYSVNPPMLKIFTRDKLPGVVLPFLGKLDETHIQSRDDLLPAAVDLMFHVETTFGGNTYLQLQRDVCGVVNGVLTEGIGAPGSLTTLNGGAISTPTQNALIALGEGAQTIASSIDIDGGSSSSTSTSQALTCVALDLGDPHTDATAFACWLALRPEFKDIQLVAGVPTLSLISGSLSVVDPVTNDPVDISGYSYVVLKGGVAAWMMDGALAGTEAKVRINASFKWTKADGSGGAANHPVVIDAVLTNLPSDTYTATTFTTFSNGETPPFGLAGYLFNLYSVLQFEGSYRFTEQDCSFSYLPGSGNVNISGGLAEWAAMNAYVSAVEYDLDAGSTEITFGPAHHLSAQELVDNIRRDRGPRGVQFFTSNILNASS